MSTNIRESTTEGQPSASVLDRIEAALECIVDSLAGADELSIAFKPRTRNSQAVARDDRFIRFIRSKSRERLQFVRVLLILHLSHQALRTGTVLTKRHIYYQHQGLFDSQRVVDELVDNVAYSLRADRDDLNITASSKGSVAGCIALHLRSDTVIHASQNELGVSIPWTRSVAKLEAIDAKWLLVVEKDAVFRSLAAVRFWETSLAGRGILVTAKGYPDLMTRSFLVQVAADCPHLPIFVLSDFDPDGLNIAWAYRYGTKNFAHESGNVMLGITWLGIQSHHLLERLPGTSSALATRTIIAPIMPAAALSDLTPRDRKYAASMLSKISAFQNPDTNQIAIYRDLQLMLFLGIKAEIQAVDDFGDITGWLDCVLQQTLVIH